MYKEASHLNEIQREHLKQARLHLCLVLEFSSRGSSYYDDIDEMVEYLEDVIMQK